MVTYISKYVPRLSAIAELLRKIVCILNEFTLQMEQGRSFQELQSSITKVPVLKYFDTQKPVNIQTNSSAKSIGCTILQDNYPIVHVTKALAESQKNH